MPANIEPILIKPHPTDVTSPTTGDEPKTPTFSPDGSTSLGTMASMSPFSSLTMNTLTPAGLDDIIQRLLTTAYSAKITKNFCLRTHEITSLCQGNSNFICLFLINSCERIVHVSTYINRINSSCKDCW